MGNKATTHKVEVRQGEVEELSLMHAVTGADGRGHDEQPGEHAREQWAHQPRNLYPNIGDCPTRYKIGPHCRRSDGSGAGHMPASLVPGHLRHAVVMLVHAWHRGLA